ncbi:MAG TPA: hypothetical protein VJ691_03225 [Vicinamibacterales bacterium]|nr:hypothetical protein [Vicinamibacterales bacterium]
MLPPRLVFVLALAAAWWPGRLTGFFDGAPLDTALDAIILGLVLPILLWLLPAASRDRRVQLAVIALLAWKAVSSTLVQDGLCVRVLPTRAGADGHVTVLKNWDVRTDWRSPEPVCSAIADRPYLEDREFPLWLLYNFAVAGHDTPQGGEPRRAEGRLVMTGMVTVDADGVLSLWTSPTVAARLTVDGVPARLDGIALAAGAHDIVIDATVRDFNWILAPLWSGDNLFHAATVTVTPQSALDRTLRPWARWISPMLISALLLLMAAHLFAGIGDRQVLGWIVVSAAVGALTAAFVPQRRWHYAALLLLVVCALRVPAVLRNIRGAFLLLAPAWLALNIVHTYYDKGFGRMDLLMPGNDWWNFQMYAYRIYMQGHWLEGGETVFWFQPFYRWIAGALHLLFGQSPIGENYWDALGVLIFALFSFEAVRIIHGFRWGCAAGALAVITYLSGPGYVFVGRGLAEISSAAFIYLGALLVMRAREHETLRLLFVAGGCAVLGVWTRLNNLPMALALAMFAWPLSQPSSMLRKPRALLSNAWYPALVVVPAAIAFGMFLFTLRTWYYTGNFSPFYGTQATSLAVWKPGMTGGDAARAMLDSVLMIATTTDPPRYHNGALPILAGAGLSLTALSGAGWVGRLPLPLVALTVAAFSSALVARGSAYSGRFSIHVVAVAVAVVMWAIAAASRRMR